MARVLIIDDEDLVIRSLERLLLKTGYEVTPARDGEQAVRHAGNTHFDLIVTDIRMPRMNGIETLQAIRRARQAKGLANIPEICMTGYADEELRRQADELGVMDYIYKPFDLEDFLACVRRHVKP